MRSRWMMLPFRVIIFGVVLPLPVHVIARCGRR